MIENWLNPWVKRGTWIVPSEQGGSRGTGQPTATCISFYYPTTWKICTSMRYMFALKQAVRQLDDNQQWALINTEGCEQR
jgi:hypothetical protein